MNLEKKPLEILYLCTGNSCRSQMAEGWAKALKGSSIEAYSAFRRVRDQIHAFIEGLPDILTKGDRT